MVTETIQDHSVVLTTDSTLNAIARAIAPYLVAHPNAKFDQYRQSQTNVRLRIIDEDFVGMDDGDRLDLIGGYIDQLDDATANQVTFLSLVTPGELSDSHVNYEFENPSWTD
ncbi:MAG: hypothetical protein ACKV2Q_26505 [Planctomycetaceae bacterium]